MANPTDLPIELVWYITELGYRLRRKQCAQEAALIRATRPQNWALTDRQCTRCGKILLLKRDEYNTTWELRRWDYLERNWEIRGYWLMCPCGEVFENRGL